MAAPPASHAPSIVVRLLARVSRADPVYRDLYLQRARAALHATLPRSEYVRLKAVRPAINRALRESREAVSGNGSVSSRVRWKACNGPWMRAPKRWSWRPTYTSQRWWRSTLWRPASSA